MSDVENRMPQLYFSPIIVPSDNCCVYLSALPSCVSYINVPMTWNLDKIVFGFCQLNIMNGVHWYSNYQTFCESNHKFDQFNHNHDPSHTKWLISRGIERELFKYGIWVSTRASKSGGNSWATWLIELSHATIHKTASVQSLTACE